MKFPFTPLRERWRIRRKSVLQRTDVSIHTSVWEVTYFWYNFLWGAGVSIPTSAWEVTYMGYKKPYRMFCFHSHPCVRGDGSGLYLAQVSINRFYSHLCVRGDLPHFVEAPLVLWCFYSHLCVRGDTFCVFYHESCLVSIHTSAREVTITCWNWFR